MTEALVSVIIPTYKGSTNIIRCINSVLEQTYSNIEIIVVDDNGKNTEEQIQTCNLLAPYVNNKVISYLVHPSNINGAAARNTGMRASNGEYIAFLDDDDAFEKNKIASQVKEIESLGANCGLVYGSILEYDGNAERLLEAADPGENFLYKFLINEIAVNSSSILIRREVVDKVGFWDESFKRHQDWEYISRIASLYNVGCVKDICTYRYKLDRNLPTGEKYEEYRLHFLNKMKPIINTLGRREQMAVYDFHYIEIGKAFLKGHNIKKAVFWLNKTNKRLTAYKVFVCDGINYIVRQYIKK